MSFFFTGKSSHKVACPDGTILNLSLESAKLMIWSADSLYRHIEALLCIFLNIYGFQMRKKRLTFVPWHIVRFSCNVVTFCGRYRNNSYIGKFQFFYQCCDLILNVAETFFIIFNKIHFVYCKYKVTDSHQCAYSCMTSCLYQYSL